MRSPLPTLAALSLLTGWGLSAGCSSVSVASSNLDALLDQRDELRHSAPIQSGWRYVVRSLLPMQYLSEDSILLSDKEVIVGDPALESLENLLILSSGSGGANAQHRQIEQVRQLARFAARCPGRLVRERALLELVPHARRLSIEAPMAPPPNAANSQELLSLLGGLLEAAEPVVRAGSKASAAHRRDLAAACELIAGRPIGLDSGWRALRTLGSLAVRVDFERDLFAPLAQLSTELQARVVAQAMHAGLHDPSAFVRATAYQSAHAIWGERFLREALSSLLPKGPEARTPVFGLGHEFSSEPEVFIATFDLVREHGLPLDLTLTPYQLGVQRFGWLKDILSVAYEYRLFEEGPRIAALRALGAVADAGFQSLRKEDWEAWWSDWERSERQRLQQLQAAEQARAPAPGDGQP